MHQSITLLSKTFDKSTFPHHVKYWNESYALEDLELKFNEEEDFGFKFPDENEYLIKEIPTKKSDNTKPLFQTFELHNHKYKKAHLTSITEEKFKKDKITFEANLRKYLA